MAFVIKVNSNAHGVDLEEIKQADYVGERRLRPINGISELNLATQQPDARRRRTDRLAAASNLTRRERIGE
jgi:hypothetical protein